MFKCRLPRFMAATIEAYLSLDCNIKRIFMDLSVLEVLSFPLAGQNTGQLQIQQSQGQSIYIYIHTYIYFACLFTLFVCDR